MFLISREILILGLYGISLLVIGCRCFYFWVILVFGICDLFVGIEFCVNSIGNFIVWFWLKFNILSLYIWLFGICMFCFWIVVSNKFVGDFCKFSCLYKFCDIKFILDWLFSIVYCKIF